MKISLGRMFYYITLICISIAALRLMGFDFSCFRYLFLIHMILYEVSQGMSKPPSTEIKEMLDKMTVAQGISMIVGGCLTIFAMIGAIIGTLHLHLVILDKTKVKENVN